MPRLFKQCVCLQFLKRMFFKEYCFFTAKCIESYVTWDDKFSESGTRWLHIYKNCSGKICEVWRIYSKIAKCDFTQWFPSCGNLLLCIREMLYSVLFERIEWIDWHILPSNFISIGFIGSKLFHQFEISITINIKDRQKHLK